MARQYGIQTFYYDMRGNRRSASPDSLTSVLRALGAPIANLNYVDAALTQRKIARWKNMAEPVIVAWDGHLGKAELRIHEQEADSVLNFHLQLDSNRNKRWSKKIQSLPTIQKTEVAGMVYETKDLELPKRLPIGYHVLGLKAESASFRSLIISAPRKAYFEKKYKRWGVFVPLYTLHSKRSWGAGDFSDLVKLAKWISGLGGSIVGTLPITATYLDTPYNPSPYAPASRLFWNEFYVDIESIPELNDCFRAQTILRSVETRRAIEELQSRREVDYRRTMTLKRTILRELAKHFYQKRIRRPTDFVKFLREHPELQEYARFRAASARQGVPWTKWPARLRAGKILTGDYDEQTMRYHIYVQWILHCQIQELSRKARQVGVRLYLDFPLGVHTDSYDVWKEKDLFVLNVAVGAPPDPGFPGGQNWGFPPLHPEKLRESHYQYFISCIRNQMTYAQILRLDHIMGLHRLYWIPNGFPAQEGAFVKYRAEELYAILTLESQRQKCTLVGENLGTVPPYVNRSMAVHDIRPMFVVQYELVSNRKRPMRRVPLSSLASINTHDMPPFAAYLQGLDIENRRKQRDLGEKEAFDEHQERRQVIKTLVAFLKSRGLLGSGDNSRTIIRALINYLTSTEAADVVINLEDLWFESKPQNVPGTNARRANWIRKARYKIEEFSLLPEVHGTLLELKKHRKLAEG